MVRKSLTVVILALVAIFSLPTAANAVGYVPNSNVAVSGSPTPGGTVIVGFAAGSFTGGESVSFSVTGEGTVTLAAVKAAPTTTTLTKVASSSGAVSLSVKLPASASGSYAVTATGLTSGNVGTASITVAAADRGLAFTGGNGVPVLALWGAGGLLLLGVALLLVRRNVRRQRVKI